MTSDDAGILGVRRRSAGTWASCVETIITGANDVWVVDGAFGEVLIPVIDDVVLDIDEQERTIRVALLPGLLEDDDRVRVDVLTIFPEMFDAPMSASIVGLAREKGLLELHAPQPEGLDARPPPHHRRRALRRRAGHGDEAGAHLRGRRLRTQASTQTPASWAS